MTVDEILEAQHNEQETKQEKERLRMKFMKERGLSQPYDSTQDDF